MKQLLVPVAFAVAMVAAGLSSCANKPKGFVLSPEDSIAIVTDNLDHRKEKEVWFAQDPASPFIRDTTVQFHGINWFPVNPYYRGLSKLHRYEAPETVTVLGTKGEERRQLKYGYFEFDIPTDPAAFTTIRMNVYKFTASDPKRYAMYKDYLSLWFTDKTTGDETYDVGRYIELGPEHPDRDHVYTVDLNKAFNPYCAYSDLYSCAIPRKEDHIDIALRVGEKKYHTSTHEEDS